jgi:hypothetical protein
MSWSRLSHIQTAVFNIMSLGVHLIPRGIVHPSFTHPRVGPERAQARAHAGLVFGLSPRARPRARPPGQARPAKARAHSVKPEPDPSLHFTGSLRPYPRGEQTLLFRET